MPEEVKNNRWIVITTVILCCTAGFIAGCLLNQHHAKSVWINVPAGQSRKFDVQETDTSINITLK